MKRKSLQRETSKGAETGQRKTGKGIQADRDHH